MQYAAVAGIVPVTLRHDRNGSGILIGQDKLGIEFNDMKSLKNEIDRLISDDEYLVAKSKRMESTVISAVEFNENVEKLLEGHDSKFSLDFKHEETRTFKDTYLQRLTENEFYACFVKRSYAMLKTFPYEFCRGAIYKVYMKLINIIK